MEGEESLRVGLVGCGGLGRRHAGNVDRMEGVELVAVCDASREAAVELAASARGGPAIYQDHGRMLVEKDLDAVLVVTPNSTHSRISIDAAAARAHVFCEKPMALEVADCDAMIEAAERGGVFLMVGYVRRFQAAYQEMKRQVDAGAVGQVRMAHALRLGSGPPGGTGGWQFRRDSYGGMFSMYSHELDQLTWLAGEVEAVSAVMRYNGDSTSEIEESIFIGLEFASGAIGSLGSSRIYPVGSYELGVAGTEGSIKITSGGGTGPLLLRREGEETCTIEVHPNDGLVDELAYFFACVRRGEKPEADGIEGRRVVAIAAAAHEAARTGRRVQVQ